MLAVLLSAILAAQTAAVPAQIEDRVGHSVGADLKPGDLKAPRLPPGVSLDRALSAEDVVAIALWNNAAFHADLASLGLARADLAEAGLLRNPNLSLLFPVGPKPFELAVTLPIEAFWQRPRRVEAARVNLEAVSHGLVQHGLDLARDVRLAWADLAFAQQRSKLEAETAILKERIAELTQRRLRAGDISDADAGTIRLEAVVARNSARRSADELLPAVERLRMLTGLRGDRTALKVQDFTEPALIATELAALLEAAFAARPDLRAAELTVQAAAKKARWERSRVVALGLVLSSKEVGTNGVRTGPGMTLDLPVFNRNQGQVSRADAEVEHASWQYLAARDRVELEVREARAQYLQAWGALVRLRGDVFPSVRRNVELLEKSHRDGDISYLAVLEGSRPLADLRLQEAEAIAALCRTAVQLERSIGRKP